MILYRTANLNDMDGVAKIHTACFPKYLTTSMGNKLLKNYYAEYCKESPLFIVAIESETNSIVGFCMGYIKGQTRARQVFVKKNKMKLVFRFLLNLFKFDFRVIKKVFNRKKERGNMQTENGKSGDLLSICLLESYRGRDISKTMLHHFEDSLVKHGATQYFLSVRKANAIAKRFYEKNGLKVIGETKEDYTFFKILIG